MTLLQAWTVEVGNAALDLVDRNGAEAELAWLNLCGL